MTKKLSIYHFLITIMLFSLIIPASVGATEVPDSNPEFGSLTIHKFEQEPGTEQGIGDGSEIIVGEGDPLEGAVYEVIQTHAYDPITETWDAVTNGQLHTLTTDGTGEAQENLPLGRYSVTEIDGPAWVNINPGTFFVDLPMTNEAGTETNYDVHIYPKNETIRGAVELSKIDGSSEDPLSGVKFDLYDAAGNKINDEPLITNGEGHIHYDGLEFGDYYFQETETINGYVLGGKVEFSIEESGHFNEGGETSGTIVTATATNYQEPEVEKEVDKSAVNRGEEVTYTITVDLPGDIKDYQSFVVTDELDNNLEFVSEDPTPGFSFSQNDQTLTWTGTPGDLTPGEVSFTFKAKVSEDAEANVGIDNTATIDYSNEHNHGGEKESDPVVVTPTVGNIQVIKQDGKSEDTLSGAIFELHDMNGDKVAGPETTDSNGLIDFGEVDHGEYHLVETKAPDGYRKLRNPIEVTVNDDNSEISVTVDNYKSDWTLPKTGGLGTTLFTVIGLLFMGTAAYLYMRRRKNTA